MFASSVVLTLPLSLFLLHTLARSPFLTSYHIKQFERKASNVSYNERNLDTDKCLRLVIPEKLKSSLLPTIHIIYLNG